MKLNQSNPIQSHNFLKVLQEPNQHIPHGESKLFECLFSMTGNKEPLKN